MTIGDRPLTDILPFLRKSGNLVRGRVLEKFSPVSPEFEESEIADFDPQSSIIFEKSRSNVREGLRQIVGFVMDSFDLPRRGGFDFGSGATGEMVEELLAPHIDKSTWTQVEINPGSIAENQRRHPSSKIVRGSYLNIEKTLGIRNKLDIATGLSSLDATAFVERAVAEIRSALKSGGYFLHIQDVGPGRGTPIREMKKMGFDLPLDCERWANNPRSILTYLDPRFPEEVALRYTVGDLFKNYLARAIEEDPEMELLADNWVTSRRATKGNSQKGYIYFLNTSVLTLESIEEVSAIVTLARKK